MDSPPTWGNPEHRTYRKNFIRVVYVDDHRPLVHILLVGVVTHVLRECADMDEPVEVVGFPDVADGRGLAFASEPTEVVAAILTAHGYSQVGKTLWTWDGTPEEAAAASAKFDALDEEERLDEQAGTPTPDTFDGPLPGSRALTIGDSGQDVMFLQVYLGLERTGTFDEDTALAVYSLKERRSLAPARTGKKRKPKDLQAHGSISINDWRLIFPRHWPRLRPGEGGRPARVLIAALIAATGRLDMPCRSVLGVAGVRVLRQFQRDEGLQPTGRVSIMEWGRLVALD